MAKASKNKKPHPGRQKAGKEVSAKGHPGPWGSVLWDYLEDIRKWRMARTKWIDVVVLLKNEKGIIITPAAVRNFFVRSRNPNLKLPDYLEHLRPHPPAPLAAPVQPDLQFSVSPQHSEPTTYRPHPARNKTPDEIKAEFERESERRQREARNKPTSFGPPPNLNA
jgi:hypothetical protein